jgi:hypothetical protein
VYNLYERISNICDFIRDNPGKYKNFSIYPCLPYAHKYANAVTELGIVGTLKEYTPEIFSLQYLRRRCLFIEGLFIDYGVVDRC